MIKEFEQTLSKLHGQYTKGIFSGTNRIERKEMEEVEQIEFAGQPCYISKYASNIAGRYPDKYKDSIVKYRTGDLVRKGGETIRRVQLIATEMLIELDRICRKNGLRYNIAYGTLAGAVRHKGFIPWDDDIDVIMPIEDYIKLNEVMESDLDKSRFFWRSFDTEPNNTIIFNQIRRNGTVFAQQGRENYQKHLGCSIDVFPVFHQSNNLLAHWWCTKKCRFYRRATWAYKGAEREKNPIKKAFYMYIRKPGNKRNFQSFMECATAPKIKNKYYSIYIMQVRSPYKAYFLSDDAFNDRIELEFEGHKFFAPKDYDAALTYVYGADYMLYPGNVAHRTPDHSVIVELGDVCPLEDTEKN